MEIKQFTSENEVKQAVDLFIQAFSEHPYNENWSRENALKRLLNFFNNSKEFCFYTTKNGKMLGFIFCFTEMWDDGIHVFIEDTVIDPKLRGQGIGTKLVKKLEEVVKNKGIKGIDLMTSNKAKAHSFWKSLGYKFKGYEILSKKL